MSQLPDTPAGRQAAWWLETLARAPQSLSREEAETHFMEWIYQPFMTSGEEEISLEAVVKMLLFRLTPTSWFEPSEMRSFERSEVDDINPYSVRMVLTGADSKRWIFSLWTDEKERISWLDCYRAHKKGVVIRFATPEDAPGLADVERLSPIERAGGTFTYDRGDDFFASLRLTENSMLALAEFEGKVVGFCGASVHRALIDGQERTLRLVGQLRSLPEHRGGLSLSLAYKAQDHLSGADSNQNFIAEGNAFMQAKWANRPKWSVPVNRAILQCSGLEGPPTGSPATKDDASRIVEILNECHKEEELFLPYNVESLSARMERAPDLYSWDHLW
ncbi:MAG: hypothetical protein ACRD1T_27525, partial [Acidimicrobiia bacterium]